MTSSGVKAGAVRGALLLAALLGLGLAVPGHARTGTGDVHLSTSGTESGGRPTPAAPSLDVRREFLERRAARIAAHRALRQRVLDALSGRSVAPSDRSMAPSVACPDGLDPAEVHGAVRRLLREEIADLDRGAAPRWRDAAVASTPREADTEAGIDSRIRELERALDRRERELADLERERLGERDQELRRRDVPLPPPAEASTPPVVPAPLPVPVVPSSRGADREPPGDEATPPPEAPVAVDGLEPAGAAAQEALPDVRVIRESFLSSGLFSSQLILFETAMDRLLPISGPVLDAVAEVLREFPDTRVLIEGHTDLRGGAAYNRRLSERRAAAVRDYLIDSGRIGASRLTVAGLGFDRPLMDGTTPTAHALNRRVTLRILNPSALAAPVPVRN